LITLFDEKAHITKLSLIALKEGALMDNDLILISEHICSCTRCCEALANSFNDNELAEAPLGFVGEVNSKIKRKREKDRQFIFYSFRVTIAACIALIFVFSGTFKLTTNAEIETNVINPPNLSIVNNINTELNNFSIKIMNMEVFNNDKEKK